MERKTNLARILLVAALTLLVCVCFLLSPAANATAYAAEIVAEPNDSGTRLENVFGFCNVYFVSDYYPLEVEYLVKYEVAGDYFQFVKTATISSLEDFLKCGTYEDRTIDGFTYYKKVGVVFKSITFHGTKPFTCSVDFNTKTEVYKTDNNNVFEPRFGVDYSFNGYAVPDTSVQNITLEFLGGYSEGYDKGKTDGYAEGYDKGVQDGYDTGYDYGYKIGTESDPPVVKPENPFADNVLIKIMLAIGGGMLLLFIVIKVFTWIFKRR